MGATPQFVAWMQHGDATTMKRTQDMTQDAKHKGVMPCAGMKSHEHNAMTYYCTKRWWERHGVIEATTKRWWDTTRCHSSNRKRRGLQTRGGHGPHQSMQRWPRSQGVMQLMCATTQGVGIETVGRLDMDETQKCRPRRGLGMHRSCLYRCMQ